MLAQCRSVRHQDSSNSSQFGMWWGQGCSWLKHTSKLLHGLLDLAGTLGAFSNAHNPSRVSTVCARCH
jgi:hypothetical protein